MIVYIYHPFYNIKVDFSLWNKCLEMELLNLASLNACDLY